MTPNAELRSLLGDYTAFFGPAWRFARRRDTFFRRKGSWLQLVEMQVHDAAYVPTNQVHFLRGPEWDHPCDFVRLKTARHRVDDWIRKVEHVGKVAQVFSRMAAQFRPSTMRPLDPEEVAGMLADDETLWTSAYALSVLASERGDAPAARRHRDECMSRIGSQEFEWEVAVGRTLSRYIELIARPAELRHTLSEVERANWTSFVRWTGLKE